MLFLRFDRRSVQCGSGEYGEVGSDSADKSSGDVVVVRSYESCVDRFLDL